MCNKPKCCIIDKIRICPLPVLSPGNAWTINLNALMCGYRMIVKTTNRLRLVAGMKVLAAAEIRDRVEFAKLSWEL